MRRYARDCPATTTNGTRAISPRDVCGYTHQRAMSSTANTPTKSARMVTNTRRRTSQPVHGGSGGAVGMSSVGCGPGKCVAAAASPESLLWAEESAELCSAWTGEGARPHTGTASTGVGLGAGCCGGSSGGKLTRAPRCEWGGAPLFAALFFSTPFLTKSFFAEPLKYEVSA